MLTDLVRPVLGGRRGLALHYLLEDEDLSETELDDLQAMIDAKGGGYNVTKELPSFENGKRAIVIEVDR